MICKCAKFLTSSEDAWKAANFLFLYAYEFVFDFAWCPYVCTTLELAGIRLRITYVVCKLVHAYLMWYECCACVWCVFVNVLTRGLHMSFYSCL